MKTIKNQIRMITLCLAFVLNFNVYAQKESKRLDKFVRVYNSTGVKIAKGKVSFVKDSILGLKKGEKYIEVNVRDIGYIKTKRSGGHNVLVGSLVGATVGAILGATLIEPDPPGTWFGYSRGDNAGIGAFVGMFSGAAWGGVTAVIKKRETYIINGDIQKWKNFMGHFKK